MSDMSDIPRRIDIHSHFFPPLTRRDAEMLESADAPWLRDDGSGSGYIMSGPDEYRPVEAPLWDPAARLAEMDRSGTTIQVISATPILFSYGRPAAIGERWAAKINDLANEMCEADPERLRPLSHVPLQDVDAACREASRAKTNGHVGVHIGNHVDGRNLDDPELVRFLHHCADHDIPVFVHPWNTMAADRMPKYMLAWLVGMPAETHLAVLSLILSGAFERLPPNLKLCFAHGGGNFAAQLARVDNAWSRRDIIRRDCPEPPSSYARRFHVDSAVFGEDALALQVAVMGADHIMMGSDYPFPLGEEEPGSVIDTAGFLDDDTRDALRFRNADAFFSLDARSPEVVRR
ncbi:MAG: amidohydrolase family protein [Acidimicrobiia bacterium]|nr:amidohydrolase family protein [Acidimicrobiia bacterium]